MEHTDKCLAGGVCNCTVERNEDIIITKEEYEYLKMASQRLSALESMGVDNWEGYEFAIANIEDKT